MCLSILIVIKQQQSLHVSPLCEDRVLPTRLQHKRSRRLELSFPCCNSVFREELLALLGLNERKMPDVVSQATTAHFLWNWVIELSAYGTQGVVGYDAKVR